MHPLIEHSQRLRHLSPHSRSVSMRRQALILTLSLLLLPAIHALAQNQTTGRIIGRVKDETGAVIAGAEVRVVSRATRIERIVITDEQGSYTVPLLPPGS